jgi:hypothetical protein
VSSACSSPCRELPGALDTATDRGPAPIRSDKHVAALRHECDC